MKQKRAEVNRILFSTIVFILSILIIEYIS